MSDKPRRKRSAVDKAFNTLRSHEGRKADAVFVCRLYRREDGSWDTEGSFRHWIKDLAPDQKNAMPPGVPGAIMAAVTSKPIQKHVGKILKNAAAAVLTPHVGESAASVIGDIIDNFTNED